MKATRLLFMHVTPKSGHHRASRAVERAVSLDRRPASIFSIDAFEFSSPFIRWAIYRIYFSLIKHQPDVWEYLYDNPSAFRKIRYLRALLHRYHTAKFHQLLDAVKPEAIICTQAYPCGVAADFKERFKKSIPVIGVLTDYAPHLYWFHPSVDCYVVPSEQVRERFIARGIEPHRIRVLGIPVDDRFSASYDKAEVAREFGFHADLPVVLIMGGSGGWGQMREVIQQLDILPTPCQMVVLTGTNHRLMRWMQTHRFRKPVFALPYTEETHKLMRVASLLISKPGGLSTAESLASHLPMVIVNPIPGQEAYNARYLVSERAAVQAGSPFLVRQTVRDLLEYPERLEELRARIRALARPNASQDIKDLIFQLIEARRPATARRSAAEPIGEEQQAAVL